MPNLQTLKTAPRAAAMPAKSRPGAAARVFGPVSSRRLGLSLGVDVIPRKRCTLDCLYCQLGRSARVTAARKEYAPRGVVLRQLRAALKKTGPVDWITFSGSGEPTLHSGLGAMIRAVKRMTATPVAVITNGTLLADPLVRRGLREADLVIPDLDAGSARVFRRINRPHPSVRFRRVVEGIARFTRGFPGRVWLEVVLLKGVNDSAAELRKIGALAARIRPERVQLNTVVRPPAYREAKPLGASALRSARRLVASAAGGVPVDIVAPSAAARPARRRGGREAELAAFILRRPATARDLAAGLGLGPGALAAPLGRLVASGAVSAEPHGGGRYYRAAGEGAAVTAPARPPRRGRRGGNARRA